MIVKFGGFHTVSEQENVRFERRIRRLNSARLMEAYGRGNRRLDRNAPRSSDAVQVSDVTASTHNSSRLWA